jgi:imidazolonepropionase-like amidohydrolase
MRNIPYLIICLFVVNLAYGQMVSKTNSGPFLIKGATIHPITGPVFVGDILIEGDRINAVSESINTLKPVNTINAKGRHVYPGFIDAGCHLGLGEIGAVSLTNDFNEIGEFIPHMQALTAVNPNSVSIPVTRTNGITTVFTYPSGGGISGTGAVIDLIGYTPEQMYAGAKAVVMYFPSSGKRGRWDRRKPDEIKKEAEKAIKKLNEIWENAFLYAKIDSAASTMDKVPEGYKPELEALLPVVRGEMKLVVEVNKAEDINAALEWLKDKHLDVILSGVREGHRVTDAIMESGYPCIVGPILGMPSRASDKYDLGYTNITKLMQAGIKVAIRTNDTENVRNLPFNAGFAATYGMGVDEALKAITINTAEIFGIADKYGSIEEGKTANLFISDGDPFEPKTQIYNLFINGLMVPIESRHTLLYDEFIKRSPGLENK